jgi:hypothetical protein
MSYDQGIHASYRFPAAAVDTDAAIGTIVGPSGKKGRVVGVTSTITVEVTIAAAVINVGNADNDARYAVHNVPVGAAGVTTNGFTRGSSEYIPADTDLVVSATGSATAGDADIIVHVVWF